MNARLFILVLTATAFLEACGGGDKFTASQPAGGSAGAPEAGMDAAGGAGGSLPEAGQTGGAGGSSGASGGSGGSPAGGSSGTGGSAGSAGTSTGGSGGTPDAGNCPPCGLLEECSPAGICVARMVVPRTQVSFVIDQTEVSNAQYAAWLALAPSATGQPAACDWNTDFTPATNTYGGCYGPGIWPPTGKESKPVVCVDWCDAQAYCKAVGKRLCQGSYLTGGGEWLSSCTAIDETLAASTCNLKEQLVGQPWDVANNPTCSSPTGVYDMVGNVWEWEDDTSDSPKNDARLRGGAYDTYKDNGECFQDWKAAMKTYGTNIGFRCCRDF